jgi:hypothetical protein
MGGCTAFVLPASGKLVIMPIERIPPEAPTVVYSNHLAGAYRTNHVEQTFAGVEDIVCRWTSVGGAVEDGVEVEATWVAPDIDGKADGNQCDLWQTCPQVEWAAEFYGRLACREERLYTVSAPLDPEMLPGMSILLHEPNAGVEQSPAYVLSVATGGDRNTEMTMTCSLGPSQISGYNQGLLPIADFTMIVVAERVLVSGQPQTLYEVFCDASGSFDPDGTITSYTWKVLDAAEQEVAPLLPVSNDSQVVIVLDGIAGLSVRLTVTDDNEIPNSVQLSQVLEGPGQQTYVRVLSTANGDTWSVLASTTGWRRWQRDGYTCVVVPKYNDAGPLLSLWSDRGIYTTADYLATDATLIATLPGSGTITSAAMFVNESDGDDWLVGAGNTLYRTTNAGQTWEELETFGGPIADCELGFERGTGYMRVLVNNSAQYSTDGGLTWDTSAIAPVGATAEAMASGFDRHMAAVSGSTNYYAVLFDVGEGGPVDWSPVVAPPSELVATTPGLATDMYTVADPLGNLYTLTEDGAGGFTAALVDTHTGVVEQLVRDGRFGGPNGQGIVYGAGAPALKLLNSAALYEIDTRNSSAIGYGALYVPPPSGWYLLIPQQNVSQAGVYQVWPDGNWTLHNAGLPAITLWVGQVIANPLDSDEWLALVFANRYRRVTSSGGKLVSDGSSYSPLWRWSGTQWEEVTISTSLSVVSEVVRIAFDPATNGRWFFSARDTADSYVYAGIGLVGNETVYDRPYIYTGCAGEGGDIITGLTDEKAGYTDKIAYIQSDGTLVEPSQDLLWWGQVRPKANMAMMAGRALVFRPDDDGYYHHFVQGSHFYTPDYRSADEPYLIRDATSLAVPPMILANNRCIIATSSGLIELSDIPSAPTGDHRGICTDAVVAMSTYELTHARIDSQSQTMIAAWTHPYDGPIYVWDSTSNTEIEVPIGEIDVELPGSWNFVQIVTEV